MKRIFLLILSSVVLSSCASKQSEPVKVSPQEQETLHNEEIESDQDTESDTKNEEANGAQDEGDCVRECIASRQMQATSIEKIESDCKSHCTEQK